jgi:hypothetical protein
VWRLFSDRRGTNSAPFSHLLIDRVKLVEPRPRESHVSSEKHVQEPKNQSTDAPVDWRNALLEQATAMNTSLSEWVGGVLPIAIAGRGAAHSVARCRTLNTLAFFTSSLRALDQPEAWLMSAIASAA